MVMSNVVRVHEKYKWTPECQARRDSVLSLVAQLRAVTGVLDVHKRQLLSIALWKWTEAGGVGPHPKYNIRYCSSGVVNTTEPLVVNHEHVHTRKSMVDAILLKGLDDQKLTHYLMARGEACIVTTIEHAALGLSRKVGWARYVDAGVGVWDRQLQSFVDPAQLAAGQTARLGRRVPPREPEPASVMQAIDAFAKHPELLHSLKRLSELSGAVSAPHNTTAAKPAYFRIHDTVIEEPTRAVCYVNFNGNVDLALEFEELPAQVRRLAFVKDRGEKQNPYTVRCRVDDRRSLDIAEELLVRALEKLRSQYDSPQLE